MAIHLAEQLLELEKAANMSADAAAGIRRLATGKRRVAEVANSTGLMADEAEALAVSSLGSWHVVSGSREDGEEGEEDSQSHNYGDGGDDSRSLSL